jgi:hypothetical protein
MKKESVTEVLSVLLSVSGILLMVWWLLLGLIQRLGGAGNSLAELVIVSSWLPVNILGLLATLLLILGLSGILTGNTPDLGTFGFLGVLLSISGAALFTAVQFDETFIWPLMATHGGELLEPEGPMFTDPSFFTSYIVMGVFFAVGFIFLSVQSLKRRIFPVVPSIFLLTGAVLFAGGVLVPVAVRTVGVLLFGIALIWIGFRNRKT